MLQPLMDPTIGALQIWCRALNADTFLVEYLTTSTLRILLKTLDQNLQHSKAPILDDVKWHGISR